MIRGLAALAVLLVLTGCTAQGAKEEDSAYALVVGDCFDLVGDDSAGSYDSVPKIDCEKPHDFEAFASLRLAEDTYPGEDATVAEADARCGDGLEDYLGISLQAAYDAGLYDVSYFYPSATSWPTGDREILCMVYAIDTTGGVKRVSGSVKGIGASTP